MRKKSSRKQIWVAVKVERGFICDARVYESARSAKQTERRWRSRINPDYDETAVIKSSFIACRMKKVGRKAE
jgi:hypothetical protein